MRMMAGFFVLGLALWATVGPAQAHQAASSGHDPRAESITQDLIALSTRYELAGPATQAQLLTSLLTVAAERQQLLAALVEEDPGEVVRVALPADIRASLPPAVRAAATPVRARPPSTATAMTSWAGRPAPTSTPSRKSAWAG